MSRSTIRWLAIPATAVAVLASGLATAQARPDDGGAVQPPAASASSVTSRTNCPLSRLGDQLLRCDDLTGAGARATRAVPSWTTERSRRPA